MFIDEAKIRVKAGDGGNGCMAFRREKFVPRGGPSGGDGGRGGDVIMESSQRHNTLIHFRYNPEHKAQRGEHGMGSNCSGSDGKIDRPAGAGRHRALRPGNRRADARLLHARRAPRRRQGRPRRPREPALRHQHPPGAPRARTGPPRRRAHLPAGTQAAGRCRPGRLSQCRQIHSDLAHLRRQAQNRRLPLHHPGAQPRRRHRGRGARTRSPSWWPMSPASSRARTSAPGWAPSSSATSSAPACWSTSSTCPTPPAAPIPSKTSRSSTRNSPASATAWTRSP